jgi:hypothetical protein
VDGNRNESPNTNHFIARVLGKDGSQLDFAGLGLVCRSLTVAAGQFLLAHGCTGAVTAAIVDWWRGKLGLVPPKAPDSIWPPSLNSESPIIGRRVGLERLANGFKSRQEKSLSLYHLAEKMGIASALVKSWESGECEPDQRQRQMLCTIFGSEFVGSK